METSFLSNISLFVYLPFAISFTLPGTSCAEHKYGHKVTTHSGGHHYYRGPADIFSPNRHSIFSHMRAIV